MAWLMWFGIAVVVGGGLLRALRGGSAEEVEPFQQRLAPGVVFCELCRDWHPPQNCAGEW